MRVLLTEDDAALASFRSKTLRAEGYDTDVASTGEVWLERIGAKTYDLMLLDLSLPDVDGTELLARLHQIENAPSVIVLTGHTQVEQRIRCLDLGADDFLVKPFSFGELAARCRAALRRRQHRLSSAVRSGEFTLHRLERRICWAGTPLDLTPKEFALLEILILRGGEACTREELLEHAWPGSVSSATNILDVYINYLRRKLESAARTLSPSDNAGSAAPECPLQTVRGLGYRLAVPAESSRLPLSA